MTAHANTFHAGASEKDRLVDCDVICRCMHKATVDL